jgi:hypothetical protein
MKDHIVYRLTSPSGKVYVGVTNNMKRRLAQHTKAKSLIGAALRKYGVDNFKVETVTTGSSAKCYAVEEMLVVLGEHSYNVARGGMGGAETTLHSPALRAKHKREVCKAMQRPEVKAKLVAAFADPELRKKRREATMRAMTPDVIQKRAAKCSVTVRSSARYGDVCKRLTALSRDPTTRAQRVAKQKQAYIQNPDILVRRAAKLKKKWAEPASRAKRLAAMEKARNCPVKRARFLAGMQASKAKRSAAVAAAMIRPETRAKMSEASRKAWQNAEMRANRAASMARFAARMALLHDAHVRTRSKAMNRQRKTDWQRKKRATKRNAA